ncbi:MAG: lysophospholipid acyltransferase family protein [Rubrimonas sp.]|uniref:lysophospholipid acyltransferase family protein n=1 Tax=Rubrimonas sp. TaxID=2036015 RepID=UPI002FDCE294
MATWDEAAPPSLPPLGLPQKLLGGARVGALVAVTGASLAVFLAGKAAQRHVWSGMRLHHATARFWARTMLWLMGVRPRLNGRRARGAGVILANHSSWADILALRATGTVNFVSKAEVRAWPGIGPIAAICDTVFIERRRLDAARQKDEIGARIAQGETLCIFPEGTSSDGLRVLPFKSTLLSALFQEGVRETAWVQPATLNWRPPERLPREFYGWWGTMSFEGHIWQVVCRSWGGEVEIALHEARPVAAFPDRKALTRHVEEAVRAAKR